MTLGNQRLRLVLPGLAASLVVVVAAGCGGGSQATTSAPPSSSSTTAASPSAKRTTYPVTITNCGKQLTFAKAPERVLGDQEQDTVPLFDLGVQDKIVAIFSHKGSDITFSGVDASIADAMKQFEELSPAGTSYPVFEKVLAARPDFIFQGYPDDAIGGNQKNQKQLDATGIPVYTESATCPDASPTMESTFDDLKNLGIIFDVQDRADAVIAAGRKLIADTKAAVAGKPTPRVFLIDSFGSKGEIYTNTSSFVRDQITQAGGIPVPESGADVYSTSREALAASNFDLVLVTHYGEPNIAKAVGTDAERAAKVFAAAPSAPGSVAKRWAAVPYPSGPETALIFRKLAEAIHPEAFGK